MLFGYVMRMHVFFSTWSSYSIFGLMKSYRDRYTGSGWFVILKDGVGSSDDFIMGVYGPQEAVKIYTDPEIDDRLWFYCQWPWAPIQNAPDSKIMNSHEDNSIHFNSKSCTNTFTNLEEKFSQLDKHLSEISSNLNPVSSLTPNHNSQKNQDAMCKD